MLSMEIGAFAEQRVDFFGCFRRILGVQLLLRDLPDFCIFRICVDLSGGSQNYRCIGPRKKNALASDDENLVGFEQPSYRSDRLDKVFKSSDERGLLHATIRGSSANVGDA